MVSSKCQASEEFEPFDHGLISIHDTSVSESGKELLDGCPTNNLSLGLFLSLEKPITVGSNKEINLQQTSKDILSMPFLFNSVFKNIYIMQIIMYILGLFWGVWQEFGICRN